MKQRLLKVTLVAIITLTISALPGFIWGWMAIVYMLTGFVCVIGSVFIALLTISLLKFIKNGEF
jgi:D-alanyl-lipoteichoic acid acyltransferase DltB (MBOAT superfamily)